jgi:hypothetical protein
MRRPRSWHFTALLDGKLIGTHDFVVGRQGDDVTVDSAAHFKVAVAFITAYVYEHRDHEVWHGGCLAQISSQTNDNGHKVFVEGTLEGDAFELRSPRGMTRLPACVRTFAYWDEHLMSDPRLLNAQTGEYQAVSLTSVGAERYALRGHKLAIDLWYSAAGDWTALESKLDSGRTLRYELH